LYGIFVDGNLSGSISNSGDISAHATAVNQASAYGINVNGELSGSVVSSGAITAEAQSSNGQASAYGITTNGNDLSGSIENLDPGHITVIAHSTNSQASAYGINTGNLTGGAYILNSGTISATATSTSNNAQASAISTAALDGDNAHILNSGTISAEANAYSQAAAHGIQTGDLVGLETYIDNSGTITATAHATSSGNATAYGISAGSLNGDSASITNGGTITAEADAYSQATAYGISTGDLFGAGASIDNSGTITATAHSINFQANAYGLSTGTLSGDGAHIINSSSIAAEATVTQNDQGAFASGIYTGELGGAGTGAYIENSLGGTITATANATGGPSLHATAYGIYAGGDLTGNGAHIINSGTIEATANAASQATAYGIQAGSLSGNGAYISNTGTITVRATSDNNNASAYGIRTGDMAAGTSLTNGGAITVTANAASQARAYGIYVNTLDAAATIANSGTITATASGATPEAYAIYVGGGSGTITNVGTLDGAVELAGGTLNLNGLTGRVTGAVTGGGGSTVNVNGTFTTENTFSVDGFNIGADGIFNMAHGVTATSGVSNGGTLSVAAGNTATITGDYTQTANGVFQTGASSLTNYGKLVVTGTADLSASNKVDVKVSSGDTLANGNVLTSVLSAGTLTAGTLTVTDNSAMWNFTGTVNGNAIDLTTEQALTFVEAVSNIAVSPAAMGVAGALDAIQEEGATGDMQTVLSAFNDLTEAEIASAVAQLMPGFTGGSAHIVQGLASSGGSRVVHQHMAGAGQGLSSGEPLFKDRMVWAQPFYSATNQSERKGVAGYNADSYGLALGADGKVDEQWRVGAALSLAKGDVDGDSPVTRENLDINTYQLTLYAADQLSEATSLNLQAGFGINDNDSSRNIQFGGLNRTATGDFTSWHTLLDAELEHRYKVNEKAVLAPYLRAQYSYVNVEDYTETGAGAINLHMDDNNEDSLVLSVGGKAAYAFTDQVKLTGHLGAGYDFMSSQSSVTSTFSGGGPAFVTEGLDPSPVVLQGGIGFEMLTANGLTITARYDVDGREDYNNQTATVNFRLPF
jgi:outer membrane autotransporter protein